MTGEGERGGESASPHASTCACSIGVFPSSCAAALGDWRATKRAMALDSKTPCPSGVSSVGTFPKGFRFRNSAVLFALPISKRGTSIEIPAYSATIRALLAFLLPG